MQQTPRVCCSIFSTTTNIKEKDSDVVRCHYIVIDKNPDFTFNSNYVPFIDYYYDTLNFDFAKINKAWLIHRQCLDGDGYDEWIYKKNLVFHNDFVLFNEEILTKDKVDQLVNGSELAEFARISVNRFPETHSHLRVWTDICFWDYIKSEEDEEGEESKRFYVYKTIEIPSLMMSDSKNPRSLIAQLESVDEEKICIIPNKILAFGSKFLPQSGIFQERELLFGSTAHDQFQQNVYNWDDAFPDLILYPEFPEKVFYVSHFEDYTKNVQELNQFI